MVYGFMAYRGPRDVQRCLRDVSGMSQGCLRDVSGMSQKYLNDVSSLL